MHKKLLDHKALFKEGLFVKGIGSNHIRYVTEMVHEQFWDDGKMSGKYPTWCNYKNYEPIKDVEELRNLFTPQKYEPFNPYKKEPLFPIEIIQSLYESWKREY